LEPFLALPHSEVREVHLPLAPGAEVRMTLARVPARHRFIAFVPQWDLLNLLAEEGRRLKAFHLLMETEATGLVRQEGRVVGLRYRDGHGAEKEIAAVLVVGADGRGSVIREQAGLPLLETSAPMDVLWFRISRKPGDPEAVVFRAGPRSVAVLLN